MIYQLLWDYMGLINHGFTRWWEIAMVSFPFNDDPMGISRWGPARVAWSNLAICWSSVSCWKRTSHLWVGRRWENVWENLWVNRFCMGIVLYGKVLYVFFWPVWVNSLLRCILRGIGNIRKLIVIVWYCLSTWYSHYCNNTHCCFISHESPLNTILDPLNIPNKISSKNLFFSPICSAFFGVVQDSVFCDQKERSAEARPEEAKMIQQWRRRPWRWWFLIGFATWKKHTMLWRNGMSSIYHGTFSINMMIYIYISWFIIYFYGPFLVC